MGTKSTLIYRICSLFTVAIVLVLFNSAFLMGCSSQSKHWIDSYSVENQFERSRLYSGMRYYANGTMDIPLALVALDPAVTLDSEGWQETQMTPKQLSQWMKSFQQRPWVEYNQSPNGAVIIDMQGNRVGYYYTTWLYPEIRFTAADRIEIDQPDEQIRITNNSFGKF